MERGLATNSIDLVVTSPPYKDCDGYTETLMVGFLAECYRVLKPGHLLFLNFGHLAEDKFRPFRVCQLAMAVGFQLNETITWVKNHYKPIQGQRRLNNLTEFIFLMHKDKMPAIDRLSIGVPYADKSNIGRFADADLKCGGNVWHIPYTTIQRSAQKLHNDRFPVELPRRCIKLANLPPGSTVLEPFAGSGTTLLAAAELGFHGIGYEKNTDMYVRATQRLGITKKG